jgi:predicted nucleotidyltransferase
MEELLKNREGLEIQKRYQEPLREFVKVALEKYGENVESIILFGSVARGEARRESDIDILVIWKGDEAEGWRAMTGLAFDILLEEEEYISTKVLGLEDVKTENPFIKNVMKEGVKMYYNKYFFSI